MELIPEGPHAAYQVASAGPLTSLTFYDELSRVTHNFLTPGQILDTISDVSRHLTNAYDRFLDCEAKQSADRGDGPRKKRKKDTSTLLDRTEAEYHAVSFALVARTMVVVLRALPLHSVTDDVRAEAERMILDVHAAAAARVLADGLADAARRESWGWQIVLAAALRLRYGLACAPSLPAQPPLDGELLDTMLSCMCDESLLPEVVVEMVSRREVDP